jgi:mRNA interferase MazF
VSEGVPERGDIVWLDFDPQAGREQAGRRPALVLSILAYNRKVGLMLCCPITSKVKGYPFEVPLPDGLSISGVVLRDQVRNFDWRARNATVTAQVPESVVQSVCQLIETLWEPAS